MGEGGAGVLRRILRAAPATSAAPADAEPPASTPARALRHAFARAADRSAGLPVAVLGVAEEVARLDQILGRLEPDLLLLAVRRPVAPPGSPGAPPSSAVGLIALDAEAWSAGVEAQTLGHASAHPAAPRAPTFADVALSRPLAQAFLDEADAATAGTAIEGWIGPARLGDRIPSVREAALTLPDGDYRVVRLTLDIGAGGRQGLCLLLLPVALRDAAPAPLPGEPWREELGRQVLAAPSEVVAVLARLRLPLALADALGIGQVLPLPGVTVASVRLEGPGRTDLGPARLGQAAGMRAVRIEARAPPLLDEMAPLSTGAALARPPGSPDDG